MAEVKAVKGEELVRVQAVTGVQLILTPVEAITLIKVLRNVGGSEEDTLRGVTQHINSNLENTLRNNGIHYYEIQPHKALQLEPSNGNGIVFPEADLDDFALQVKAVFTKSVVVVG